VNIFVLDLNIELCAQYHCDKHVVKMILETAQLLSSAVRMAGLDAGYKLTHKNHPCAKWARESIDNYYWLSTLAFYLNEEYKFRYNHTKNHKSYDVICELPRPELPEIGLTPFAQAMPDEYKSNDAVESYRAYYMIEKANLLSYTKRGKPEWLLDM
jgi:hypothetical protein